MKHSVTSTRRWRAVRTTLVRICWGLCPGGVRFPPQILRFTTVGRASTRRDEGKYRQYVTEEQRRQAGCSAGRMQLDFHHGLLRQVLEHVAQLMHVTALDHPG